jgi:hypothetical protein
MLAAGYSGSPKDFGWLGAVFAAVQQAPSRGQGIGGAFRQRDVRRSSKSR